MNTEKIISRVKKLLAMADDISSPEEAAIAATRARSLIDKHQISTLELDDTDEVELGINYYYTGSTRQHKPTGIIALAVAKLNDCKVEYVRKNNKLVFMFSGFLDDIESCHETLFYLIQKRDYLAKMNVSGRSELHAYKAGFASGVAAKINEVMTERNKLKTSSGKDLVVVKMNKVEDFFGAQKTTKERNRHRGSVESFNNGFTAGKQQPLHKELAA